MLQAVHSPRMLRLVGYFLTVFAVLWVLRQIPVLDRIFGIQLFGFFLAAILVSAVGARLGAVMADRVKQKRLERQLGNVDTPYNRGKLGVLLQKQGRHREALPHLEAALEADPSSDETLYRSALARLGDGDAAGAAEALDRLLAREEDYAYGQGLLALSRARLAAGEARAALEAVDRHDRSFGPTPESAYRRGKALRAIGDRGAAARAFASIGAISGELPGYQKRDAAGWWMRAQLARLGL